MWDLETGALRHKLEGFEGPVSAVAITPDNTRLVTASLPTHFLEEANRTYDKTMRVWDLETGALLHSLEGHTGPLTALAATRDGTRLVTGSEDQTAQVWDLETGSLLHSLEGHTGAVTAVGFTPDGARVVTGSSDETARIWDVDTGLLITILTGHRANVRTVAITPDGASLVTAAAIEPDQTARVWNIDPKILPLLTLPQLLQKAGAHTNYRACRQTGEVVAILPFPAPDTIWAPESQCGRGALDP